MKFESNVFGCGGKWPELRLLPGNCLFKFDVSLLAEAGFGGGNA